jgi:single-strand DNA-binding protein
MAGVNRCIFIGNLTREVEVRFTKAGQAVAAFAIACNETYKDKDGNKQESVEFVNITAWGKLGEICEEFLSKGKQVYVEGKLKTDSYEDKEGNKRQSTSIVINNMTMLGQREQAGPNSQSMREDQPHEGGMGDEQSGGQGGGDELEDSDIPF